MIIDDKNECEQEEVKHLYNENLKGRIIIP